MLGNVYGDDAIVARADSFAPSMVLPRGKIVLCRLESNPNIQYYVYWPIFADSTAKLFVSVHGISRNADEHARLFSFYAERAGVVLVAPIFPRETFPHYQMSLGKEGELHADKALFDILDEVKRNTQVYSRKIAMFGFSGGGQFVHRFAMRYPSFINRYVVASAGWYTFPDPLTEFPRGVRCNLNWFCDSIDLQSFLSIPAAVIVGERDNAQDSALNQNKKIIAQQGGNRLDRGQRWVQAMTDAALLYGIKPQISFSLAPRCGHSFRQTMQRGHLGVFVFSKLFNIEEAVK